MSINLKVVEKLKSKNMAKSKTSFPPEEEELEELKEAFGEMESEEEPTEETEEKEE